MSDCELGLLRPPGCWKLATADTRPMHIAAYHQPSTLPVCLHFTPHIHISPHSQSR